MASLFSATVKLVVQWSCADEDVTTFYTLRPMCCYVVTILTLYPTSYLILIRIKISYFSLCDASGLLSWRSVVSFQTLKEKSQIHFFVFVADKRYPS